MQKLKLILTFALGLFVHTQLWAIESKAVPELTGPVVDQAHVMSPEAINIISAGLIDLKNREHVQFQVLLIDTLENDVSENYSIKVTDKWKIGEKGKDLGALFLIAVKEHKVRIEVGRGLEGDLNDLKSHRIIEQIGPILKTGNYDKGVATAISLMARAIGKEIHFDGSNLGRNSSHRRIGPVGIIVAIFVFMFIMQFITPFGGGGGFGGGFGGFGGGFGGGGGSGGDSGGSDWSGDGGGFGGGGSSGDY